MNLNAILSISGEPIPTGGGASSWDDISDKPFSTVDTEGGLTIQDDTLMIDTLDTIATIDYVDQQIDGVTTTLSNDYATKAELADVDDEIPHADNVTIIDNNGIWSAVGGSGSVQIDNKSLVKVNDVIQEAVPVYSEQVTTTYGPGAKFTYFEYPSGNDLDFWAASMPQWNQTQDYYNVYLSVNGVMYQGTWTAVEVNPGTYYGGWGTLLIDLGSGTQGYELYVETDNSGIESREKFHIYLNGNLISGSGSTGNVDWLLIEPSEEDASFEQWARNVSRWGTVSHTENIYHKLPHEYYDGVQEVTGYYEPEGTVQDGKAIAISSSGGIRIDNYITEEGYKLRVINLDMDTKSLVGDGDGLRSLRGDAFTEKLNSSTLFHFSYDSDCDLFDCGEFDYWLGSGGYGFIIPVKGTYILIDDRNNTWSAKGYESLFDSVEIIPHADPETEYNGKYYSDGTSVVQFVHPKFSAQQGDGFEGLAYSSTFGYFDYAKLNAQFLPIDNNTIRVNSDGIIYATGGSSGGSQSDWNEIDSTADSYIANKPAIASGAGTYSVVEAEGNSAQGSHAHAEGYGCMANGVESHAEGLKTIARTTNQHVQGKLNVINALSHSVEFADIIGNGASENARSNAEATDWNGNKYLAGDVYTHVTDWTNPQNNSIKLANIPAPPTTDDTYTLQAVVTNGEVHYYWLGTPQ